MIAQFFSAFLLDDMSSQAHNAQWQLAECVYGQSLPVISTAEALPNRPSSFSPLFFRLPELAMLRQS